MRRCPCCGCLTIDDYEEVIIGICEVGYWQYDETSQSNPLISIEPNKVPLIQAKDNYKKFGAVEERFIPYIRKPREDEK